MFHLYLNRNFLNFLVNEKCSLSSRCPLFLCKELPAGVSEDANLLTKNDK